MHEMSQSCWDEVDSLELETCGMSMSKYCVATVPKVESLKLCDVV